MRMVRMREPGWGRDFGNGEEKPLPRGDTEEHGVERRIRGKVKIKVKGSGRGRPLYMDYSRTLSSSFLRPQSAAAWTKASTTGCGFFSVEDNCGWNSVAMKKRWVGDSMARISPSVPRATTGKPASMVAHSYSGLTSKLQKNSS